MIKRIKKMLEIGIINTLRMNIHYFGRGGVTCPCFIVSKHLKINKLGGKVIVEKPSIGCIKIGFGEINIIDEKYERSIWFNEGIIVFKGSALLGRGCRISNSGNLIIGNNFTVNGTSNIVCSQAITFGDNNLLSWDCLIMDTDFHKIYSLDDDGQTSKNNDREITFGNHVWLGCRCIVLKGSKIPDNSVIAAGSHVTKILPNANSVYCDNTAIINNISWKN